jgi:hypothetical protein
MDYLALQNEGMLKARPLVSVMKKRFAQKKKKKKGNPPRV